MDEARLLIIGANGQVGTALRALYPKAKQADSEELDISSHDSVQNYDWSKIDVVLNVAAYTNVDGAESTEGRIDAWKVNAFGVAYLSEVAIKHDLTLVHISTEYVFDGTKNPHIEDETFTPLSVYGASKAAGDIAVGLTPKHYILRTSWVVGEGKNFVRTMLGLAQKSISPTVVSDQVGRLTFATELARAIDHLLKNKAGFGTYNVSNNGEPASWADITRKIFELSGHKDLSVTDTTTAEYFAGKEGVAPRPLNSTFDLSKMEATGFRFRDWQEDLREYISKEESK